MNPSRARGVHCFDPEFDLVRMHVERVADGETAIIRTIRIPDLLVSNAQGQDFCMSQNKFDANLQHIPLRRAGRDDSGAVISLAPQIMQAQNGAEAL